MLDGDRMAAATLTYGFCRPLKRAWCGWPTRTPGLRRGLGVCRARKCARSGCGLSPRTYGTRVVSETANPALKCRAILAAYLRHAGPDVRVHQRCSAVAFPPE